MGKLASRNLAFLDVETTGLSAWFGDRICKITILRTEGDAILDTFDTLVNPERPLSPGAARVNGLTEIDLADPDLPPIHEVLGIKKRIFIDYVDQKGRQLQRWISGKQYLVSND